MSLPIVQIKRRNKDTSEEYSTAQLLNGLIEGELGFNYFDKSLWIGPLGSSTGREYSVLVNSDHKLYDGSWVSGTTAGPVLSLRDYETRNSSFNSITLPSIPSASASASGVVTTGAQTFAGLKTFNNGIKNIGNFVFTNAAGTYSATLVGPGKNVTFNMPDTGGTIVTHATKGEAVGSASKPVYIATTGRATACSNYAGGTAVTLNGTSKSAASASFYAPTSGGTSGQLLESAGSAAPAWVSKSDILVGGLEVPLLTGTIDFNTYYNNTSLKFYSVSSGATTTNGPVSNSGDRYSFYSAKLSSTTCYQEAFSQVANKKYYRTSQNATDWNAWQVTVSMPVGTAIGSGTQPIYIKADGTPEKTTYALHKTVPSNAAFTDANVSQGKSTTANWRPILSHNAHHATYGTDPGSATGSVYYTPSIAIQPSTGTIRATKFIGEFEGTITNAKKLSNYYSTRPTTLSPGITGDGSVITFKCTSSVTDTDDPGDGHVLHFNWDNNGGYDSQILMMTSSSTMKYRGMNGTTWQPWVTSIDSGNYTQYTVTKTGSGASGTWDISINGTASKAIADADGNTIKTTYAKIASANNLVHSGNEITMVPDGYSGELWLNWRTCGGANGNITKYNFGNGKNGTTVTLVASNFSGVAAKATLLETARTIFGKSFNGGADVKGSALVYGTYTATANQRYNNAGLQIREADQVLATQSDIGYAPSISFHWGNRVAATLLLHHDGIFYFRKQDGVTRATVDANVTQVNGVTPEWAGSISNADARWIAAWTSDGKKIKALDKNTMTVLGASQATGTTFSIKNSSGGDVDLIFDRNANASWKILNSQGNLHFQNNWTTSKGGYYDVMKLHYNSGNVEIKGSVKVGGGCTLEYDSSQQSLKFIFA